MKIETKYNIGDRVWIVKEGSYYNSTTGKRELSDELEVFDDYITAINIEEGNNIIYVLKYADMIDLAENDIILYNEKDKLIQKIEELMNKINEREEKGNGQNK